MRYLFLFCLVLTSLLSLGQQVVDGVYLNDYCDSIIIKANTFVYKTKDQTHNPVYFEDTIAFCSITKVENYLYEINSTYLYTTIAATKIVCKEDIANADSIKIHFQLPYSLKNNPLEIEVVCYTNSNEEEGWSMPQYIQCNEEYVAYIPLTTKCFRFTITPTYYVARVLDSRYHGLLSYSSPQYDISPTCRDIEVSIPVMNNGFFERYYPYHEYIYIKDNLLHWKGLVFERKKGL